MIKGPLIGVAVVEFDSLGRLTHDEVGDTDVHEPVRNAAPQTSARSGFSPATGTVPRFHR